MKRFVLLVLLAGALSAPLNLVWDQHVAHANLVWDQPAKPDNFAWDRPLVGR